MTRNTDNDIRIYPGFLPDREMRFARQSRDGTDFLYLSSDGFHYTFGYYSNNSWVNSHILILARTRNIDDYSDTELVAADVQTQSAVIVAQHCGGMTDFVTHGAQLCFIDSSRRLHRTDLTDGTDEVLHAQPNMAFPHMTRDGRYMNWDASGGGTFAGEVFDLETRSCKRIFEKRFAQPFPWANHMMVCPTDPDLLFFAHEGTTQYITNRLWLAQADRAPRNIARQKLNENGELGDCFGHECWAPDGRGLYFVKYVCSPVPPCGICYVDAESGEAELLFSGYPYWHVSCAPDGRHLGADTQNAGEGLSGVCVIDRETKTERLLLRARTNWKHPCHPHPSFNTSSDRMAFHDLSESGMISVGVIDL